MRWAILGGLDRALVSDLDPALDRQAAPIAAGPGEAVLECLGIAHGAAGDAISAADHHAAQRDRGLVDRVHRLDAIADCAGGFGGQPDHEAGVVDQMDHRQAELVGQLDEAFDLLAGLGFP